MMKKIIIGWLIIAVLFIVGCTQNKDHVADNSLAKTGINIGEVPPDFTITTTENEEVKLKSFADENKPVLVYFMATWCPFCAKDFAALSKVYNKYERYVPIIVMSLDLSEDAELLAEYKNKYPLLEKVMFAPGESTILTNYEVTRTTTKYAISKEGKIIYKGSGAFKEDQWVALLEALKNA